MAYRLILDENVEHEVFHRLETVSQNYPQTELQGLEYLGEAWL